MTTTSPVPKDTWPGAFEIYKNSRDAMRLNVWNFIGLEALGAVASSILQHAWRPAALLGALISIAVSISTTHLLLATARQQTCTIQQALQKIDLKLCINMLLLTVLVFWTIVLSLLLFVVPFFFVMPRLVLAPYYLVDKNLGVLDAYKASWNDTKGHVGKMWGIIGVNLLFALLCVTIIGIPFAIYFFVMYSAASTILYLFIQKKPSDSTGGVVEPPAASATA